MYLSYVHRLASRSSSELLSAKVSDRSNRSNDDLNDTKVNDLAMQLQLFPPILSM